MLKKYGMEDYAPMSTPMTTNCKLSKDDDSPLVDATHYKSMIGALLYLTTTRPDIIQAVGSRNGGKISICSQTIPFISCKKNSQISERNF